MADLKTTYKDDVLNTSANEKRKYNMITNEDGTVSLVDATDYSQVGDSFGAADINATNEKVNELNTNLPKIQCGSGSIVKGTVITDITFKKSFSSVPTVIVAPKDLKSDELESDVRRGTFTANSVTVNGFQCYIDRNANTYDLPFYWIAME